MKAFCLFLLLIGINNITLGDDYSEDRGRLTYYKTEVSPPYGTQDPDLYCNRSIQWYRLCRGFIVQVCTDYAVQDAYYDRRSGRCVVGIYVRHSRD